MIQYVSYEILPWFYLCCVSWFSSGLLDKSYPYSRSFSFLFYLFQDSTETWWMFDVMIKETIFIFYKLVIQATSHNKKSLSWQKWHFDRTQTSCTRSRSGHWLWIKLKDHSLSLQEGRPVRPIWTNHCIIYIILNWTEIIVEFRFECWIYCIFNPNHLYFLCNSKV